MPSGLDLGPPDWNLGFGGLLRLSLNSCCFLGLFVFCCTVAAYLTTDLFTLSAHLLINTVSSHARRSISHKGIPQDESKRQINKQTSERTKRVRAVGATREVRQVELDLVPALGFIFVCVVPVAFRFAADASPAKVLSLQFSVLHV